MSSRSLRTLLDRARDWWTVAETEGRMPGPSLDPAYNGWYVGAPTDGEATDDTEDVDETVVSDDIH